MQWLLNCYDKVLEWSQHRHAPMYLAVVCLIEASVFPIPPYFMLAPMVLAKPTKGFAYAGVATISSVCGGVLGYVLGYLIFKPVILPILQYFNQMHTYDHILQVFNQHGFLALLILGVSPLPYKLVAVGSGFLNVPLYWFVLTSILSRGLKFFALAILIKAGGSNLTNLLRSQLQKFGMIIMGAVGILLLISLKVFA